MFSKHQSVIEKIFLQCYASELASMIHVIEEKNCNGCLIDDPSQQQYDCSINLISIPSTMDGSCGILYCK